jgi:leader peptidase (prepilin peptidase)/N-methyltransferase
MLVVALLFGLVVGSFLNVVVHRLPRGESIVFPGSRCPSCAAPIRPWDNVPVLSWLLLRGRCRACGARISPRYPALEAATGLVFLALAARYGASLATLLYMAFAAALLAAALIDFDHQIIPDELSLGGLFAGLVAVPLLAVRAGAEPGQALWTSAVGALLGGGLLWSVGFLHARVSVLLGRRFPHWPGEGEAPPRPASLDYWTWFPGMGFGDVKLLAMVGAFLGPAGVLETVFTACFVGLLLGLASAAATRSWSMPFGFGPAIALGALAVLLSPVHWLALAVLLAPFDRLALA